MASVLYLQPSCQPGKRQGRDLAAGQAVKHPIVICRDRAFTMSTAFCYGCTSVRNAQSKRQGQRFRSRVGHGHRFANGLPRLLPSLASSFLHVSRCAQGAQQRKKPCCVAHSNSLGCPCRQTPGERPQIISCCTRNKRAPLCLHNRAYRLTSGTTAVAAPPIFRF